MNVRSPKVLAILHLTEREHHKSISIDCMKRLEVATQRLVIEYRLCIFCRLRRLRVATSACWVWALIPTRNAALC